MSICLLLIDDGREDYLARCQTSLAEQAPGEFSDVVTVLDHDHRLGFAGAIQKGWEAVLKAKAQWVFHVEGDFVFTAPVYPEAMAAILDAHPHLAQISLKRQAVNERERAAGGIVEADPEDFEVHYDPDAVWTEHRRYFTTNPSLYATEICKLGWPQVAQSEGVFTHQLLEQGRSFAIYGGKFDPPRVQHIGARRAGHGY